MTTETPHCEQPRLCVDCAHYIKPNRDNPHARCGRKTLGISMVDGNKIFRSCEDERDIVWQGSCEQCGRAGQFWIKRTDKLPF